MSPSKRERENARRRYSQYQQQRAAADARTRRRRVVAMIVVAALALGTIGTALVISSTASEPAPDQEAVEPVPSAPAGSQQDAAPDPAVPDPAIAEARTWTGTVSTNLGDIAVELDGALAPQTVANFIELSGDGFFDAVACHRLTTGSIYVLQCGDPTGTGTGGPDYRFGPIENAPDDDVYPAGTLAMARTQDPNSHGSQFFIVYADSVIPRGTGGYTVFGQVTGGLEIVQDVAAAGVQGEGTDGRPATDIIIEGVQLQ